MKISTALIVILWSLSSYSQNPTTTTTAPKPAGTPTTSTLPQAAPTTSSTSTTIVTTTTSTTTTTTPIPLTGNAVTSPSTGISFNDVSASFMKACGEDKQKNCPGFREEKSKEVECLDNNSSKLTATCRKFLADFKQGRQALMNELAPCSEISKRYCGFVSPYKPADQIVCLRLNERRLSPQCKTVLEKYKNVN
ncbi:MAG: hypothetical protein ACAH59_11285 [Pseudobdellovibrionaceae bacterium]